jgi:hypothetical protein
MTKKKKFQLGKLPPAYTFFLNPYRDERFTRCPKCQATMLARKKPFLIHIDPRVLMLLNMTGRYCPRCELIILHKDRVEDLLTRAFERAAPSIIGNDYLIIGTVEPAYWRKSKGKAGAPEVFEHLHDFKEVVIFEALPRWVRDDSE